MRYDSEIRTTTCLLVIGLLTLGITGSATADLKVGDPAPALGKIEWIKGGPVDLAKDASKRLHLVEFWATWCPPCKVSIPLLTELQRKFANDLTILGITAPDPRNSLEGVKRFVKDQGDSMAYTIGFDADSEVNQSYMVAAGATGIPHAFLVGRDGRIYWQGSPLDPQLGTVVRRVLNGGYDIEKAKRQAELDAAVEPMIQRLNFPIQVGNWPAVLEGLKDILKIDPARSEAIDLLVQIHVNEGNPGNALRNWAEAHLSANRDNVDALTALCHALFDVPDLAARQPDIVLSAARRVYELGGEKPDSLALATYAQALSQVGALEEAITMQERAVQRADAEDAEELRAILDYYKKCLDLRGGVRSASASPK
jgi:thiol-disulfide isomerase/thioredoxin